MPGPIGILEKHASLVPVSAGHIPKSHKLQGPSSSLLRPGQTPKEDPSHSCTTFVRAALDT
eukprot:2577551-Karenia_brevis.AAC.1